MLVDMFMYLVLVHMDNLIKWDLINLKLKNLNLNFIKKSCNYGVIVYNPNI